MNNNNFNLVSDYCPCCGGLKNKMNEDAGINYIYTIYLKDPSNFYSHTSTTSMGSHWDTAVTILAKNSHQAIMKLPELYPMYKNWGVVKISEPFSFNINNSTADISYNSYVTITNTIPLS